MDLDRWAEGAHEIKRMMAEGQDNLASKLVGARLLTPLLTVIDIMGTDKVNRWLTLAEVIRKTGRSRNYYEKPQRSLGSKSRLPAWQKQGLVEQTEEGIWLISPRLVPREKVAPRPPELDPEIEAEADAMVDGMIN